MRRVGEFPRTSETMKKVRVRLSSNWLKWPMWPFRTQKEESQNKFMHSGILMKNEEGGWVSTQFRDVEKGSCSSHLQLCGRSGPKRRNLTTSLCILESSRKMRRVGEFPRNSETLKKVRVRLNSSWPKSPSGRSGPKRRNLKTSLCILESS